MASSINMVVIEGNLGKDAETRFTSNNIGITSFSVAVNESYKDKNGDWQDSTSWIEVSKWQASEYLRNQLKKGQNVTVCGRLKQQTWTDNNGKTHYKTLVIADRISIHKKIEGVQGDTSDYSEQGSEQPADENDDLPF
jgi:single-strand DNA-binding protein